MTTASSAPVRAAIYCRISLASLEDTTKTDDQERICRDLAQRRGWELAAGFGHPGTDGIYTDHSSSAWQPRRKRPAWEAMIADVEAGHISAIVVYHGDRLLRTQEDLLVLINLARTRSIKLASPTGDRDLGNYDDQFILEIEASMAKRESANTSRRRKAQYARWRREGRVRTGGHGGRAFGFQADGLTHHPAEAAILADAATRMLAGQSLRSIVRELEAGGVRSPAGNVISLTVFKRILMSPRLAGLMPDGEQKGAWEPVLDRAQWESLRAVLSSRPRNAASGRGAMYLLSGIARCVCGHPMYAGEHKSVAYRCPRPEAGGCGKTRRKRELLDAYIISRLAGRLARDDNPAPRSMPTPALAAEFRRLAGARAETAAAIADPALTGRLSLLLARLDSQDARLAELRALADSDARARLYTRYAGITEKELGDLPLAVQRSLVSAFLDITVLPATKHGPGFHVEDLRVIPL